MADDRGSSAAAVVLVFLSGAALGAVAALLLAPQTGRESREQLRGYARRAEGDLRDLAGRAGEVLEEVVGDGKEFVDSKKTVLREAFDAGREAMPERRADLDLHIGLLTEHELTRVLQMLDVIQDKLGIVDHANSDLADLEMETKPEDVLAEIHRLQQIEYNTRQTV